MSGSLSGEIQGRPWSFMSGVAVLAGVDLFQVGLSPVPADGSQEVDTVRLPAAVGIAD